MIYSRRETHKSQGYLSISLYYRIEMAWNCLGQPYDHHAVELCTADKLPHLSTVRRGGWGCRRKLVKKICRHSISALNFYKNLPLYRSLETEISTFGFFWLFHRNNTGTLLHFNGSSPLYWRCETVLPQFRIDFSTALWKWQIVSVTHLSIQDHDSYRAFRSLSVHVNLSLGVHADEERGGRGKPSILMYANCIRCLDLLLVSEYLF